MIIDYTRLIQILNNSKVQTTNNPLYQVIFSLIRDSMQFQATIEGLLSELESSVNNINIKPIVLPNATIIPNDSDGEFNESFSIPGPPGKDGPIGPIGPAGASGNFITQFIPVYDAEDGQDSLIPGPLGPPGQAGGGVTQINTDDIYIEGGPIVGVGTISATTLSSASINSSLHSLFGGI